MKHSAAFPPRSGYEKVGGLVMIGRTIDKIRLHQAGLLPSDYNLGHGLDGRLLRFLKTDYQRLCDKVSDRSTDEQLLQWSFQNGRQPDDAEIFIFNAFMAKRGWRDDVTDWVAEQKQNMGCPDRADIQTAFDVHDFDEKRK